MITENTENSEYTENVETSEASEAIETSGFNYEDSLSSADADTANGAEINVEDGEGASEEVGASENPKSSDTKPKTNQQNRRTNRQATRSPRRKPETVASLNTAIEKQEKLIEKESAHLKALVAKRNELYVAESKAMGLLEVLADPKMASKLAELLQQTKGA